MIYEIRMKNCAFFARHGVYDQEEFLGQRFYVDAVLLVDAGTALENDSIEGTVDYGRAFQVIEMIIAGERRYLIEAIALEIGYKSTDSFVKHFKNKTDLNPSYYIKQLNKMGTSEGK